MHAFVLAVVLLVITSFPVYAQSANWRTMTKAQLEALPKEQLAQLPFFEVIERTDAKLGRAKMETVVAMSLHRLFFAMDKPLAPYGAYLDAAVREFQGDIGAKADGTLTLGQFQTIMDRVQTLDRAAFPIFPPFKRNLFVSDKYASFGGTWIIENERHAFPVNHTLYKCYRDEMLCYTSEAYLISTGGSGTLSVDSTTLKILKWDQSELLMEDSSQCRISTLSVNLSSKDVMMVTRDKGSGCEGGPLGVPKLTAPRISRLVDGFQSVQASNRTQDEAIQKLYSKRWQRVVQDLKR